MTPAPHCKLERICRLYHNRTFEYRVDKSCGLTCGRDTRTNASTTNPRCLCEQCRMTVEQCRAKNPTGTSAEQVLDLLKRHVIWLKEFSRNQLFDAHMIGEMIKEAELRAQRGREPR